MPIDFNDNLQIRAPKPIDDRYGPWETIEEGLINVPYPYRYDKLTLNINGVEYWFKEGLEDVDLIIKEYGGVSVDTSKWESDITLVPGSILHGRLYNWYAVSDPRGLAPEGWHVPTDVEWQTLIDFAGGESVAGGKLKETGFVHWNSPNSGATNEVGFNALGSGYLDAVGDYVWKNTGTLFAISTLILETQPTHFLIRDSYTWFINNYGKFEHGISIRLIKDNSINEGDVIIDGDTYNSITIGTQVWLQQNLAVRHYQNGDLIGSDFTGTIGAVTAYNNDETNVYNFINGEDLVHIRPKYNKRIDANIIDNLPSSGTTLTSNQLQILNTIPLVCSDEKTDIVASLTESKIKFVFQTPQSFTNIIGELNVSAAGGTFTVDITKNGVSILSTYLTFDSGETSTRTALIPKVLTTSPVSFDIGDYVEVFVRMVGALVPGKGLKIYLM